MTKREIIRRKAYRKDGICPRCGLVPKLTEYNYSYCLDCHRIKTAEYRAKNKEQVLARQREGYKRRKKKKKIE